MGHILYCLYFTDFVGESVFHGDPAAPIDSPEYDVRFSIELEILVFFNKSFDSFTIKEYDLDAGEWLCMPSHVPFTQ